MATLRRPKQPAMTMQLSDEVQRALRVYSGNLGVSPGKVAEDVLRKALAPIIAKLHELPLHLEVEVLGSAPGSPEEPEEPEEAEETEGAEDTTPEGMFFKECSGKIDAMGRDRFALELAKERDFARLAELGQTTGVSREDVAVEIQKGVDRMAIETAKRDVQNWFARAEIPLDQEDLVRSLLGNEEPLEEPHRIQHNGEDNFDPFA